MAHGWKYILNALHIGALSQYVYIYNNVGI